MKTILSKRVFFKGTFDLAKDIIAESKDSIMTVEEFESVYDQIQRSDVYYACVARYESINKAAELCKAAEFNCDHAQEVLEKRFGRLLHYTGD